MDDVVWLVAESYAVDAMGQHIPTRTERQVFATVKSISGAEFARNSGREGIAKALVITTPAVNYRGEEIVKRDGKYYAVYRTYIVAKSDDIELYVEPRAGV